MFEIPPMQVPRKSFGICYFEGNIVIAGGSNGANSYLKDTEMIDLSNYE